MALRWNKRVEFESGVLGLQANLVQYVYRIENEMGAQSNTDILCFGVELNGHISYNDYFHFLKEILQEIL